MKGVVLVLMTIVIVASAALVAVGSPCPCTGPCPLAQDARGLATMLNATAAQAEWARGAPLVYDPVAKNAMQGMLIKVQADVAAIPKYGSIETKACARRTPVRKALRLLLRR